MKRFILGVIAYFIFAGAAFAAAPEVMTYQGRLKENGIPVTGNRDITITLCDNPSGAPCYPPVPVAQSVYVSTGLFKSTFTLPSGADLGSGELYLQVNVNTVDLLPREKLTSVPYALYASSAVYSVLAASASYASALAVNSGSGVYSSTHVIISGGLVASDWSLSASTVAALEGSVLVQDLSAGQDIRAGVVGRARSNSTDNDDTAVGASFEAEIPAGMNGLALGLRTAVRNEGTSPQSVALMIDSLENTGTLGNTYGLYIATMTAGTQSLPPYALYSEDPNARVYLAGNVGISSAAPAYALSVSSASGDVMWVSSHAVHAVKFVGDGSGLTGVTGASGTDNTKLPLTGGTMQGTIDMDGNFIAGVSTITMLSGSIAIVPPGTGGTNTSYGISIGSNAYNNYTSGIGIGFGAYGNSLGGVGLGADARTNYSYGIGVGNGSFNNYSFGVGIGNNTSANWTYGVGVGAGASGNRNYGVGIGAYSVNNKDYAVGVGAYTQNVKGYGTALGAYSYASSSATALGAQAKANAELSMALGYGTVNDSTGTASFGSYGIHTSTAVNAAYYQINGSTVLAVLPAPSSIAVGPLAGMSNTSGAYNVFVGRGAGSSNTTTTNNTMVGYGAGTLNTGAANTFIGSYAGNSSTTGGSNIVIGYLQEPSAPGANNELNVGGVLFGQLGFKTIGISTRAPQAALDIVSTGTLTTQMAQLWRDSSGLIVGSMSVTGSMQAVRFVGDGSGLTGVTGATGTDPSKVLKAGDTMTGGLVMSGSSITVNANVLTQSSAIVTNSLIISTGGAIQTVGAGYGTFSGNARGHGAVDLQTSRGSAVRVASGRFSVISGGENNTAAADFSAVTGGLYNTVSGYASVASGYQNSADGAYSAVSGGYNNVASGPRSVIAGGYENDALSWGGAISGGLFNVVSGSNSVIGGGAYNTVLGTSAVVSGGENNTATGMYSGIISGNFNQAMGDYSVVAGGWQNTASGVQAFIGGGYNNLAVADSVVVGGANNTASGGYSIVGGGWSNKAGAYAAVGGGDTNKALAQYASVAGGKENNASGMYAAVPGGYNNTAEGNYSFAAGGRSSSTAQGAFTWQDSGGAALNLINNVTDRTVFKSRGGFMVTGSTNASGLGGLVDRGVIITGNGLVGISTYVPQAALDIVAAGSTAGDYAQIWRDSGGVTRASVTATGVFYGDGSGLTNLPVSALGGVVPVIQGGTGAIDYLGARINLGLVPGTSVQAYDADLDDLADGELSGSKVGPGVPAANIAAGQTGANVIVSSLAVASIYEGAFQSPKINRNGDTIPGHLTIAYSSLTVIGDTAEPYSMAVGTGTLATHLYVSTTGNVGMGTVYPQAPLHLSGAATTEMLRIANPSNNSTGMTFRGVANGWLGTMGVDPSGVYYNVPANFTVGFRFAGVEKASVTASGEISAARYQINGSTVLAVLSPSASMAVGVGAGRVNTGGNDSSFFGASAGYANTSGALNTFVGSFSGYSNTNASGNTFVGASAGYSNVSGGYNTALGNTAGYANTTGHNSVMVGSNAGRFTQTGSANTLLGVQAAYGSASNSFSSSTVVGYRAGYSMAGGANENVLLGFDAGYDVTTGTGNIVIGPGQDTSVPAASGELNIGGVLFGNLSAKTVGISTRAPQAALDVVSTATAAGVYAQIWRDSSGVIVASITSQGRFATALAMPGDNLGNHTAAQALQMGGYAVNTSSSVSAGSYQVNGSTVLAVPGSMNTMVGILAGNGTSGSMNTIVGDQAGSQNAGGTGNTYVGAVAGYSNVGGLENAVVGRGALDFPSSGSSRNAILGAYAGYGTAAYVSSSTLVGYKAGYSLQSSTGNILIGFQAGDTITSGSSNILIGNDADLANPLDSNKLNIGGLILGDMSLGYIGINGNLSASTITVQGNAFSVGASTFVVKEGRVGINWTTPEAALHVSGTTKLLANSATGYILTAGTMAKPDLFFISTGGIVGIGDFSATEVSTDTLLNLAPVLRSGADIALGLDVFAFSDPLATVNVSGEESGLVGASFEVGAGGDDSMNHLVGFRSQVRRDGAGAGVVEHAAAIWIDRMYSDGGGTMTNTYGLHISSLTVPGQVTPPYAIYSEDANARTYFAGNVGISSANPVAALVVSSAAGTSDKMLIVSTGTSEIFSVKGNGEVYTAGKFIGDGSSLTNISPSGAVLKTGDFMTGQLTTLSTITVRGNAFSVGGSTFSVLGGSVAIGAEPGWARLHILAQPNEDSTFLLERFGAGSASSITGALTRGTEGGELPVADGDIIMDLRYRGYDGVGSDPDSDWPLNAALRGVVDGTPADGVVPLGFEFHTSSKAASDLRQRMSIRADGRMILGPDGVSGANSLLEIRDNYGYYNYLLTVGTGAATALAVSTYGTVGIGIAVPQQEASLDVRALGITPDIYGQIWRNGMGVVVGSMSATGVMKANYFIGNGAGLTGITATDTSKVLKAGDTMSGPLLIFSGVAQTNDLAMTGLVVSTHGAVRTSGLGHGTATPGTRGTGAVDLQTKRSLTTQVASGDFSILGGGYDNKATGNDSAVLAGYMNTASGIAASVVSGLSNTASQWGAFIGAGRDNTASGSSSFIGGGGRNGSGYPAQGNTASQDLSAVVGGGFNVVSGSNSFIGAGLFNTVTGTSTVIVGGESNGAYSFFSFVGGGKDNGVWTGSDYGSVVGGRGNFVYSKFGHIGGGSSNVVNSTLAVVAGGYNNIAGVDTDTGLASFIGGGSSNNVLQSYGVIGGGMNNDITAAADYGFVGGGYENQAGNVHAAVAGGWWNQANGLDSFVGGGWSNLASAAFAVVAGGQDNTASGPEAVVVGGSTNTASGTASAVIGGRFNQAGSADSAVVGGLSNTITGTNPNAFIGGGQSNNIAANGQFSIVGGGRSNEAYSMYSAILGGNDNLVSGDEAAVVGGSTNSAVGIRSFVGGGQLNQSTGTHAVVGGGYMNVSSGSYSAVLGGYQNTASSAAATVLGGEGNWAYGNRSVIGGGAYNSASAEGGTVSGGQSNMAGGSYNTTVGGGNMNKAYADRATVGGGESNEAWGEGSVISGGSGNKAWGSKASVPGGYQNSATGNYSFAAGYRSTAAAQGTFSWADSQGVPLVSDVADQVRFKARGGFFVSGSTNTADPGFFAAGNGRVGIGTMAPQDRLQVTGGNILLDDDRTITWGITPAPYVTGNDGSDLLAFGLGVGEKMKVQPASVTVYNADIVISTNSGSKGIVFQDKTVQTTAAPVTIVKYKTTGTTKNNNNTLSTDPDLQFYLGANEIWQFEAVLYVYTNDTGFTSDFRTGLAGPGFDSLRASIDMYGNTGAMAAAGATLNTYTSLWVDWTAAVNPSGTRVIVRGTVDCAGTGGTFGIQWAPNTLAAFDTTVLPGSYLKAIRVN